MKRGPVPLPLRTRFERHIDLNGPIPAHKPRLGRCHLWTGAIGTHGYGVLNVGRVAMPVQRVAFFLTHGRWPEPFGLHRCDNRRCCRASHVFEGTPKDNTRDCIAKDRQARGSRNGHARLTDADVLAIRAAVSAGESRCVVGDRFQIGRAYVGQIVRGERWQHIGGSIWEKPN